MDSTASADSNVNGPTPTNLVHSASMSIPSSSSSSSTRHPDWSNLSRGQKKRWIQKQRQVRQPNYEKNDNHPQGESKGANLQQTAASSQTPSNDPVASVSSGGMEASKPKNRPRPRRSKQSQPQQQQRQSQQPHQPSTSSVDATAATASAASDNSQQASKRAQRRRRANHKEQSNQQADTVAPPTSTNSTDVPNVESTDNRRDGGRRNRRRGQAQRQQSNTRQGKKSAPHADSQSRPSQPSSSSSSEVNQLRERVAELELALKQREDEVAAAAAMAGAAHGAVSAFNAGVGGTPLFGMAQLPFPMLAPLPATMTTTTTNSSERLNRNDRNAKVPPLPLPSFTFPQPTSTLNGQPVFAPFLPRPPDCVPFVPVIAPLPPLDIDPINSGASSHSDTDSEYGQDEDEEDEGEDDQAGEGEDGEGDEEDDDFEVDDDDDEDDDDDDEDDNDLEASTASANDRHTEALMDGEDDSVDVPPSALSKKDQGWLKRFTKSRQAKLKSSTANSGKSSKSSSSSSHSIPLLSDIQAGVLPPEVITEQVSVEYRHRALIDALRAAEEAEAGELTPMLGAQDSASGAPAMTLIGETETDRDNEKEVALQQAGARSAKELLQTPPPKNSTLLQDCVRAYIFGIQELKLQTKNRIRIQEYNFEHGIEEEEEEADDEREQDEDDADEDEDDDDDEGDDDGDDIDNEDDDDVDDPEQDEDGDSHVHDPDDDDDEEDGLHKFMKAQFKKAPRKKARRNNNKTDSKSVDTDDITLEDVSTGVAAVSIADSTGASIASTSSVAAAIIPPSSSSFVPLPVVHSVAEAEQASQKQVVSPTPNDHHVPAHKHGKGQKSNEEDEEGEEDHHHEHQHHHHHHNHHHHHHHHDDEHGHHDYESDEDIDDDVSESGSESSIGDGEKFPYERNLFSLCPSYHFIKRLYACDDAVTYKAFSKLTNRIVAIKICDGYDGKVTPKEVRLLNSAQGHPNICVMNGWHPFGSTHSYAIITEFIENEPIDTIFDDLRMHKVYMRDLLAGLQHLHERKIIFRDIKPSNVLWSREQAKAIIIDFDVGSYFDPVNLHRSMVGTDGYMSPEMMLVKHAKRRKYPLPYKGYGLACDIYAAGMVLGQLLFGISEDDVADLDNAAAKGEAFIERALELASRGQANLGHHLMVQMLHPEPKYRISVQQARAHPWFKFE